MRNLSSEMQSVATAETIRPILLIDCGFDSGSVYLWNGIGNLSYDSKTYIGAGNLLAISEIAESTELTASGASITLSGINSQLAQLARDENYQGRSLDIKLGVMDENGDVISSAVTIFGGFMDVMTISDSGDTSSITVTVENNLIRFDQSKVRRFTDEDQKIEHPTDKGFDFVSRIQETEIFWGRYNASGGSGSAIGGSGTSGGAGSGRRQAGR